MKYFYRYTLFALLLSVLLCGTASAEELPAWGSVQDETVVLYLPGAQGTDISCQIGNAAGDVHEVTPLNELQLPVETVILIDNSLSIQNDQRSMIKELLSDLIANRLPGEQYIIATISDQVNYLCIGEDNYGQLKIIVDDLSFQDQHTQLTDGVYNVLDGLKNSDDGILRRLLIIADGVDNKQIGYTPNELSALIQEIGYPIYTVGCTNSSASATEELQSLFALSRLTPGDSYYLPEIADTMTIVSGIIAWNESIRITVKLPAEICDGLEKALRITDNASGNTYMINLKMPLAELQEPTESPEPDPVPAPVPAADPDPEPTSEAVGNFPWLIFLIAIAAVVIIVVIIVSLRRKKNNDQIEESPDITPPPVPPDSTEILSSNSEKLDLTEGIWDQSSDIRLAFQNLDVLSQRIEVPLKGEVIVGRDASVCQVVLAEPSVARKQCKIFQQGSWIMVVNLSQSNKTKLEGHTVVEACELVSGSTLQMGRIRMRVDFL